MNNQLQTNRRRVFLTLFLLLSLTLFGVAQMPPNTERLTVANKDGVSMYGTKIRVNGIKFKGKMGEFAIPTNYRWKPPHKVEVYHPDYPLLVYDDLEEIPGYLYLIPEGGAYYWSRNIKIPFTEEPHRIGVLLSREGHDNYEQFKELVALLGLVKDSLYGYELAKQRGRTRPVPMRGFVFNRADGEDFARKGCHILKALRESELVQSAGPFVGLNQLLFQRFYVSFDPEREEEVKAALEALPYDLRYKPGREGEGYGYVKVPDDMGYDALKILDALQTLDVLKQASASAGSLTYALSG